MTDPAARRDAVFTGAPQLPSNFPVNSTTKPAAPASQPGATPGAPAAPAGGDSSIAGEWTFSGITDPAWMGVSRGFQYNADTINSNANMRRSNIQARADYQRPQIQYESELARRDTSFDAESRGILRSGEHERMLAEQMRKEQQRLADLDLQTGEQLTGVEVELGQNMADLRRQFAEKGQEAAYQQYLRDGMQQAEMGATNAQPAAGQAPVNGGMSLAMDGNGRPLTGGLAFDGWAYYTYDNGVIRHIGDPAMVERLMASGVRPAMVTGDQVNNYRRATGLV